jgi:hypothetical protein
MKLYKVPGAQPGERWHASKSGLKAFDEVETPHEGRQGMVDFLNANESEIGEPHDFLAAAEQRAVRASGEASRPMEADGHPVHRTAYTVAEVAASALPKSVEVQDICHAVAKLRAMDLGYVALEVMARAAKLGGVPGVGDERAQG